MLVETIITDGTTQEKSTPTTLIRLSVENVSTILVFMDISSEAKHSNLSCYANLKCLRYSGIEPHTSTIGMVTI